MKYLLRLWNQIVLSEHITGNVAHLIVLLGADSSEVEASRLLSVIVIITTIIMIIIVIIVALQRWNRLALTTDVSERGLRQKRGFIVTRNARICRGMLFDSGHGTAHMCHNIWANVLRFSHVLSGTGIHYNKCYFTKNFDIKIKTRDSDILVSHYTTSPSDLINGAWEQIPQCVVEYWVVNNK